MINRYVYEVFLGLLQDLNDGAQYRCKKGRAHSESHNKVYRIKKIGGVKRVKWDGWDIAHALKYALNKVYLRADQELTDEQFFEMPIHIFGEYVEVDII